MKAALNGHLALVDRLLGAGADPQAEDKGGYTAVMLAASNNHAEVVEPAATRARLNARNAPGLDGPIRRKQGHLARSRSCPPRRRPGVGDSGGRTAADWARRATPGGPGRLARAR
jgi:ankyrin repeat protein